MIISTTGTLSQDDNFLVYHGPYAEIIPQMAEDGYQGVEMHIFDSMDGCITVLVLQTRRYERQPSGIWNSIW